jgi:hypothetical protein
LFNLLRRPRGGPVAPPAPDARFTPSPSVVFTREGERTILLDHRQGQYFGLDEVGTRVWELLSGGASLARAADALEAEYEAPREVLERDAAALAARLEELKLLVRKGWADQRNRLTSQQMDGR